MANISASPTELAHPAGECPGLHDSLVPGHGRLCGHEGAVVAAGGDQSLALELAVGAGHRIDGHAELGGQAPDRGEAHGRLQDTACDGGGDLGADLFVGGDRRSGIQDDRVHRTFVAGVLSVGRRRYRETRCSARTSIIRRRW